MILILSEHEDINTDEVCKWLNHYETSFVRLNNDDTHYTIDVNIDNEKINPVLNVYGKNIPFSEFSTVWFRRGRFCVQSEVNVSCLESINENNEATNHIQNFLFQEFRIFSNYLYWHLKQNAKCFNFPSLYNINKLLVLECAARIGLNVPPTIVTTSKKSVTGFIKDKPLITKNISDWFATIIGNTGLALATKSINIQNEITDNFFYSLFQQQLEKSFEVRTFIWDNKTYSAAIYAPPENKEAKTDFRNDYDGIKIVPYQLPKDIEKKLLNLMKKVNLESGSADFIIDNDLNFHFLEVNPVGQFDFVDKNCNYGLAKIIAETLISVCL